MNFTTAAKLALHRTGVLATYHRWRNRDTLTVLMFHRVLPAGEIGPSAADPAWTVSAELFENILTFLRRHYHFVSLGDVLAARAGRMKLPPRALLVSFDDGWRDNLDHALPILRRCGVPAVLFVASDAIEDASLCWWQEVLLWALRSGRKGSAELALEADPAAASPTGTGEKVPELGLLLSYAKLDAARRDEVLRPLVQELERRHPRPHMLDPTSLRELAAAGVAIGVHGAAHLPLTELDDPADDLIKARSHISTSSGQSEATALSFPHGRYDARVVRSARKLGFEALFTSDAVLNSCPGGSLDTDLVGRIPVFAHLVTRPNQRLAHERLATFLFLRPAKKLVCAPAGAD
jgi:peptidoglycan/xylan/chitin deacetylase (PgdA/CDA1 family)